MNPFEPIRLNHYGALLTERSGGHVDHFDIVERVEMGQMASMFFNKGNTRVASSLYSHCSLFS